MSRDSYKVPEYAGLFPESFVESEFKSRPKGWAPRELTELIDVNPRYTLSKGIVCKWLDMRSVPGAFPTP